jgi:hypothetical protein
VRTFIAARASQWKDGASSLEPQLKKSNGLTTMMTRIALVIFAAAAVLWMALPQILDQATEIGFEPGSPDPNVYQTSYLVGWPLTWISWERSRNEAAGYDDAGFGRFHIFNFAIHVLAILTPLLLLYWLSRCRRKRLLSS